MPIRTTPTRRCTALGHPELTLTYDDGAVLDVDVDFLVQVIESQVAQGARFSPGQTFQIGWLTTRIAARSDGTLGLHEPDMKSWPSVWNESVSNTLSILRLQRNIAESFGLVERMDIPTASHTAILCNRVSRERFSMNRAPVDGRDSGWFIGCLDEDHDHDDPSQLSARLLYQIVLADCPGVLPYLALPVDFFLVHDEELAYTALGDDTLDFVPGSYLDRLDDLSSLPS